MDLPNPYQVIPSFEYAIVWLIPLPVPNHLFNEEFQVIEFQVERTVAPVWTVQVRPLSIDVNKLEPAAIIIFSFDTITFGFAIELLTWLQVIPSYDINIILVGIEVVPIAIHLL
jgi:hypothetical protein